MPYTVVMIPDLSRELLQEYSENFSYSRGLELQNAVKKLDLSGDGFSGYVFDSRLYKVNIFWDAQGLQFDCACHKDGIGLCPHCVAVGLEIVFSKNKDFLVKKASLQQRILSRNQYDSLSEFTNDIFFTNRVRNIINLRKKELKKQAQEFQPCISINKLKEKIKNSLIEYAQGNNNQTLEEALSWIKEAVVHKHTDRKYLEAFCYLIAFYEVSLYFDTDEVCDLDYSYSALFDEAAIILRMLCDEYSDLFHRGELNKKVKIDFWNLLFSRPCLKHYEIKILAPVLLKFIDVNSAEFILKRLPFVDLIDCDKAFLSFHCYKKLGMEYQWVTLGELYHEECEYMAEQLIYYYHRKEDWDNLIRVGRNVLSSFSLNNKMDLAAFLYYSIDPLVDLSFFYIVASYLLCKFRSLNLYRDYKEKCGELWAAKFLSEYSVNVKDGAFYVKLLEEEQRFDDIIWYLRFSADTSTAPRLFESVISRYPRECLDIIRGVVDRSLVNPSPRKEYRSLGQKLLLLKGSEDVSVDFLTYLSDIKRRYGRRETLREEFTELGLFA